MGVGGDHSVKMGVWEKWTSHLKSMRWTPSAYYDIKPYFQLELLSGVLVIVNPLHWDQDINFVQPRPWLCWVELCGNHNHSVRSSKLSFRQGRSKQIVNVKKLKHHNLRLHSNSEREKIQTFHSLSHLENFTISVLPATKSCPKIEVICERLVWFYQIIFVFR